MGDTLYVLQAVGLIILALMVLVTIHELGHFGAAKLFKIRVDTFSIFFPPKLFSFKWGETTYQLGAIPVGGFVKIAGMIDESNDTEFLDKPVEEWEFRSRPVWQRFVVMVAGVVMNVILAIIIYSTLKFAYGELRIPMTEVDKYGITVIPGGPGEAIGLQNGDRIISYNGEKPKYVEDIASLTIFMDSDAYFEVDRNGETLKLAVPGDKVDSLKSWKKYGSVFLPGFPPEIQVNEKVLMPGAEDSIVSPAYKANLKTGDVVLAIEEEPVTAFSDMKPILEAHKNDTVKVAYDRDGAVDTALVAIGNEAFMGVGANASWEADTIDYGFFGAIWAGTKQSFGIVGQQLKGYKKIGTGKASLGKNMSGIIGIAALVNETYEKAGWPGWWGICAFLSMILAFVNILPIPALDGGHIMFLLWEGITGKEPSPKVKMVAQYIGLGIVLLLLIATLGIDIKNLLF